MRIIKYFFKNLSKKGFEEEGMHFNVQQISLIILAIIILAVVLILLVPKLSAQKSAEASSSFGKQIWEILSGGGK